MKRSVSITLSVFLGLLLVSSAYGPARAQRQVWSPASVQHPVYFDVSPPLRDMAQMQHFKVDRTWKDGIVLNRFNVRGGERSPIPNFLDPALQDYFGQSLTDTTVQNFEGLGASGYIPPDTDGDIGQDFYFQVVNANYAIYNKSGEKVLGPLPSSSVWNGMPNNSNDGDAIVLYDENANRWLFSQFSLPNYPNAPFYQMIAVSQTPDPTGPWYRYQYTFTSMPDYPKFGIWPDGYYMSCNRFSSGSGYYVGTGAAAFDRTLMLAGDPDAEMIWFTLSSSNDAFGMLPSDCDGPFPPAGTPNYFVYEFDASPYHLGILEFQADWDTPANSTFGNLLSLPVTSFNPSLSGGIPQLGTSVKLATLSDRLMFRLQFRNFGDHWSMVTNHTVNAGGSVAGIRWYELRKSTSDWSVYQEGTYAPSDNNSRWMGSIAMDSAGNMALGFSISSSNMYPSIRYTGRMSTDALNQMTITERSIMDGGGCQTSTSHRWGDYSALTVDPSAPTTFWYTQEYYPSTSNSSWHTRIASFTFENVFSSYATAFPVKVCLEDSSQLQAVAYGGSGTYTYSWTSDPPGFTSDQKEPKVLPVDSTRYICAISDGTETHYDTTQVNVIHPPDVFAGNDTMVCEDITSIEVHGMATSYRLIGWVTSGNGHFDHSDSLNTVYHFGSQDYLVDSVDLVLVALPILPCSGNVMSVKNVALDPCTGIGEPAQAEPGLTLSPNPASGTVRVTLTSMGNAPSTLSLMNLVGQTILTATIPGSTGQISRTLDLKNVPPGVYLIRLNGDKKVLTQRLVVY